jgi:hypothetical protein
MNAAKPSGLQIGSTRPLSRAERRAEAARVKADDAPSEPAAVSRPFQDDDVPPTTVVTPDQANEAPVPSVRLKVRQRKAKNPFATQLRPGTLARLEWIKARGYAITDTVDEAINTYLDNAGIARPDHNDRMPS